MTAAPENDRELALSREIDVAPDKLWRCWTEPSLLTRWFTPPPWTTSSAELDVRPGGSSLVVMAGPDGTEAPNRGVYLQVDPGRKLVFTDAYVSAWEPSPQPFMTVTLTFEALGPDRTRYTARVAHWTLADRERHEAMGFHQGWGVATDQLAVVARGL